MTYTALACLALLDVPELASRLDRAAIVASVRAAQQPDGSFASTQLGSECDLRFTYAACCISHMLGDWSGVDIARATEYIRSSLSYEGAFGQGPLLEAHGGSTFCGVAALKLMVWDGEERGMGQWMSTFNLPLPLLESAGNCPVGGGAAAAGALAGVQTADGL